MGERHQPAGTPMSAQLEPADTTSSQHSQIGDDLSTADVLSATPVELLHRLRLSNELAASGIDTAQLQLAAIWSRQDGTIVDVLTAADPLNQTELAALHRLADIGQQLFANFRGVRVVRLCGDGHSVFINNGPASSSDTESLRHHPSASRTFVT
jgi:hypothetical protein